MSKQVQDIYDTKHMSTLSVGHVREAVRRVRDDFLARQVATGGIPMCLFELNNGLCREYADEVVRLLGYEPCWLESDEGLVLLQTDCFQKQNRNGDLVWDTCLLRAHWNVELPSGLSKKRLDALAIGHHVWLAARAEPSGPWLHFDAECVDGAASLFDLPLFRRYIEARWPSVSDVRAAAKDHVF